MPDAWLDSLPKGALQTELGEVMLECVSPRQYLH